MAIPLPLMEMVMVRAQSIFFLYDGNTRQHDGKQHDDSQRNTFDRIREIQFQTNSLSNFKWAWYSIYLGAVNEALFEFHIFQSNLRAV